MEDGRMEVEEMEGWTMEGWSLVVFLVLMDFV